MINIRGVAPESGRFHFDICSGDNPDDIVFHFNPRFNEDCVVRNSRMGGDWGGEEREGKMPFSKGKKFLITVICQSNCFLVLVDNQHFCRYEFRAPISDVMHVEVRCGIEYL